MGLEVRLHTLQVAVDALRRAHWRLDLAELKK